MTNQCSHGQLRRQCEVCDLTARLVDAEQNCARIASERACLEIDCHELRAEVAMLKDRYDDYCMSWRGLDREADKVCVKCGGSGQRIYGSTATWRGGIGGQAMTRGVCDRCWGSGDESLPWPSWRERDVEKQARASAESRLAALREAVEKAPHGSACLYLIPRSAPMGETRTAGCNCWKKSALDKSAE